MTRAGALLLAAVMAAAATLPAAWAVSAREEAEVFINHAERSALVMLGAIPLPDESRAFLAHERTVLAGSEPGPEQLNALSARRASHLSALKKGMRLLAEPFARMDAVAAEGRFSPEGVASEKSALLGLLLSEYAEDMKKSWIFPKLASTRMSRLMREAEGLKTASASAQNKLSAAERIMREAVILIALSSRHRRTLDGWRMSSTYPELRELIGRPHPLLFWSRILVRSSVVAMSLMLLQEKALEWAGALPLVPLVGAAIVVNGVIGGYLMASRIEKSPNEYALTLHSLMTSPQTLNRLATSYQTPACALHLMSVEKL